MASLRSIILHGRFANLPDEESSSAPSFIDLQNAAIASYHLGRRECVLVNSTNVAIQCSGMPADELADILAIPVPKPPFHVMWLENQYLWEGRLGCLVQRIDVPEGRSAVEAYARRNRIQPVEAVQHGAAGSPQRTTEELEKTAEEFRQWLDTDTGAKLDAFAQIYDNNWGTAFEAGHVARD